MALTTKSDVPSNLYWEANRYSQLVTATDRTDNVAFNETSTTSGTTYAGSGGTDELLTLLETALAIYNVRAVDYNAMINLLNDLSVFHLATISTREVQFTLPSWTFANNRSFRAEIPSTIASGGDITIKIGTNTALVIKDTSGTNLTTLTAGYYTFVAKDDSPDFFVSLPF